MKLYNSVISDWVEPEPWQLDLKIGDCYAIYPNKIVLGKEYVPAPTVYGRIKGNESCNPGYFIVLAYSQWAPQGEVSDFCICNATHLLTEEQFIQAKKVGWPELPEIL